MDVVAVTALDQAFVYSMVIGLGEISLRGGMTSITELGLGYCQEMLRFLRVVRGMTVQAADIAAGMR